jgi:hypothetical protein
MTATVQVEAPTQLDGKVIRARVERAINARMLSLPTAESVSPDTARGIIARYTAVLEGNFIYWMTGAYIACRSDEARAKIMENLHEEVRDSHPGMMRRFALAAKAVPSERDSADVYEDLTKVRVFVGLLAPVPILTMMAYFEGFIQQFMPYLAEMAAKRGSSEREYTDVHGICDIGHTEELFNALNTEIELCPEEPSNIFEGMERLDRLVRTMVFGS